MELEALESSVETALERVNSAMFEDLDEESVKKALKHHRKLLDELDRKRWSSKGMILDKYGKVPTGLNGFLLPFIEGTRGLIRGALIGATMKGSLSLVFSLLQRKKLKDAIRAVVSKDTQQFAGFVSAYSGVFRFVNAFLGVWKGEDEQENAFWAGVAASFTIMLDDKERRQGIALYLFVRGIDVYVRRLSRLGVIPYWKHFENLMFGVANIPIMFGFLFEPNILQPGYYRWILNMGDVTHDGLDKALREVRRAYFERGEVLPMQPCSPHYHQGPCTTYCTKDWFLGLGRAGKIYLPVHLLPLLIFRWKVVLQHPVEQLVHTGKALIASCMFLSTYVFVVKSSQCFLRHQNKWDYGWHGLLAGLLTGLSTYFERKSRVSELMLYCWPRALEATYNYLHIHYGLQGIENGELFLFMIGSSILMSINREDFKKTYHQALCYLIGATGENSTASGALVVQQQRRRLEKQQDQPDEHEEPIR